MWILSVCNDDSAKGLPGFSGHAPGGQIIETASLAKNASMYIVLTSFSNHKPHLNAPLVHSGLFLQVIFDQPSVFDNFQKLCWVLQRKEVRLEDFQIRTRCPNYFGHRESIVHFSGG